MCSSDLILFFSVGKLFFAVFYFFSCIFKLLFIFFDFFFAIGKLLLVFFYLLFAVRDFLFICLNLCLSGNKRSLAFGNLTPRSSKLFRLRLNFILPCCKCFFGCVKLFLTLFQKLFVFTDLRLCCRKLFFLLFKLPESLFNFFLPCCNLSLSLD